MKRDKCNKSSTEQVIEYSQQQKKELTREAGKNGWLGSSEREFVTSFRRPISTTFGHLFGIFFIFNCAIVYSQRNNDIFAIVNWGAFGEKDNWLVSNGR
jgi:hypothetical protein